MCQGRWTYCSCFFNVVLVFPDITNLWLQIGTSFLFFVGNLGVFQATLKLTEALQGQDLNKEEDQIFKVDVPWLGRKKVRCRCGAGLVYLPPAGGIFGQSGLSKRHWDVTCCLHFLRFQGLVNYVIKWWLQQPHDAVYHAIACGMMHDVGFRSEPRICCKYSPSTGASVSWNMNDNRMEQPI